MQLYRINEFLNICKKSILIIDCDRDLIEGKNDLDEFIKKNAERNLESLFVIDADCLIDHKVNLIGAFEDLYHQKNTKSILYFFRGNITYPHFHSRLSKYASLFENTILFPYFQELDRIQFIKYLEAKFQITIPKAIKQQIIKNCGGNLWLIKEAVRYYSLTSNTKNIFDHQSMLFKLEVTFGEFEKGEKEVLFKIVKNTRHFDSIEKSILQYFKSICLIHKVGNSWKLTIPILEVFIRTKLTSANQLGLDSKGNIVLNNIMVNNLFSKREKSLLKYFLQHKNQILSREKIGNLIWHSDKDYSDWALDQIIRRLRIKLESTGFAKTLIKTIKNQGYAYR